MHFTTRKFEASHCRKPKGRGCWAFGDPQSDTVVFTPHSMTLTEAKKWFKSEYPEYDGEVQVLP